MKLHKRIYAFLVLAMLGLFSGVYAAPVPTPTPEHPTKNGKLCSHGPRLQNGVCVRVGTGTLIHMP